MLTRIIKQVENDQKICCPRALVTLSPEIGAGRRKTVHEKSADRILRVSRLPHQTRINGKSSGKSNTRKPFTKIWIISGVFVIQPSTYGVSFGHFRERFWHSQNFRERSQNPNV